MLILVRFFLRDINYNYSKKKINISEYLNTSYIHV